MANDGYGIQILTGPFSKWLGEFLRSFLSSLKHMADCAIIPGPSGLQLIYVRHDAEDSYKLHTYASPRIGQQALKYESCNIMRYFDAMSAALQNAACTFSRGGGFTKYAYPYHGNTSRFTPVHCRTGSFALDGCEHTKEFSGKADIYGL
jgi:hypothetical protein